MIAPAATRPRLGFLGAGWIGAQRMDAIVASGAAEAAAVCDPAVEGALKTFDELLEQELDGVVIATPSALHAEQAIAALDRGLAVFCQKPLALSAAEAREVADAARRADRLLGVDLSYRFTEAARCVRDAAASGALGDVYAADLVFHNAYGPDKPWFYDRQLSGGGCLLDLGVHLVDVALFVLGFPHVERVTSSLHGGEIEDHAAAQLELAGGAVVRIACSWRLHAGRDCVIEASFYGTHGVALQNVGGSFYDLRAVRYDGTSTRVLCEPPDDWGGRAAIEWAQRLAENGRFDPAAEEYVAVHETLDRIYARSQ